MKLKLFSTYCWIYVLCPIWSFIINLIFFIVHINEYQKVKLKKLVIKSSILTNIITQFKWKEDNLKDWIPWIYTLICNDFKDDCDGAATLAKYWYKENNIKSRLVFIYTEDFSFGHCICVVNDNKEFISNNQIIEINSNNWKQDILDYFSGKYSLIIEK